MSDRIVDNLNSRLNDYLRHGKFSMENVTWKYGYVTMGQFRQHLKNEMRSGRIVGERDNLGRIWYRRA
jgi:hypothetical protein